MLDLKILVSLIVARGYLLLVFNAFLYTIHWAMYTTLKWCGGLDVVPLALTCLSQCFLCMILKSLQNTKTYFNEFDSVKFVILNVYNFLLPWSFYLVIYFHILYSTNTFISGPQSFWVHEYKSNHAWLFHNTKIAVGTHNWIDNPDSFSCSLSFSGFYSIE